MDPDVERELNKHEERLNIMERCQLDLSNQIGQLIGKADSTLNLIKYVIFPLLVIVGALVGIKLAWPGG